MQQQETADNDGARVRAWRHRNREPIEAWTILTPALIYYTIFFALPVLATIILSFTHWSGMSGGPEWVGLDNFRRYLTNSIYLQVIGNTLAFAVIILAAQMLLAVLVALMLNRKIRGRSVFRAAWYIPSLTSPVVMALIALTMISPVDGVINMLLKQADLPPVIFYLRVDLMWLVIIIFSVWRGVGSGVILYLAALQGIHPELYEAARVDGASPARILRHVTLPLLKPVTIFVLVTGIIGSAQIFEAVLFLSRGGPGNQTNVMMLQIYQDIFTNADIGMASAGSVILGVMLLTFAIINLRAMSRGYTGS
ncbi:MAG: sugar ABC transporter permease [Chloroflexi bacterium]|nr:sugar ABC transporter permease [Chloroflexota bacterium]MCL5275718.1 sugar ABC transporter permease [Chloroflexota bacterium]